MKFRIVNILKKHILEDISINDFKMLTDALDLDTITLRIRDAIIELTKEELIKIQINSEFDLLESLENEK